MDSFFIAAIHMLHQLRLLLSEFAKLCTENEVSYWPDDGAGCASAAPAKLWSLAQTTRRDGVLKLLAEWQ
jgi:hypothetical protein